MAKNAGGKPAPPPPSGPSENEHLRAENARLLALLAQRAGGSVAVPAKARTEILAGPHHWRWEGKGSLFLGKNAWEDSPAVYRSGDVVPEEFALENISDGAQAAAFLVPYEGEAEPNDPTPESSPNARLPRPQAHDRAVTKPAPADPPPAA